MIAHTPIDDFIQQSPEDTKVLLRTIRDKIASAIPDTEQVINYGIPTFQLNGKNVVHFGPAKSHIGFYATPDGHAQFEQELGRYKRGKGSVQFPIDEPMPYDLIVRMSVFRANQVKKGMR